MLSQKSNGILVMFPYLCLFHLIPSNVEGHELETLVPKILLSYLRWCFPLKLSLFKRPCSNLPNFSKGLMSNIQSCSFIFSMKQPLPGNSARGFIFLMITSIRFRKMSQWLGDGCRIPSTSRPSSDLERPMLQMNNGNDAATFLGWLGRCEFRNAPVMVVSSPGKPREHG